MHCNTNDPTLLKDPLSVSNPMGDLLEGNSFSEIHEALTKASRILIVSHARPDGDALGSTLAAAMWLQNEGHVITAWNEDGLPEKFSYLPGASLLGKPTEQVEHFDAVLVLDTASKNRLGETLLARARAPLWVAIDHHVSNEQFTECNWIEPRAPATGQMLAAGFLMQGIPITPEMATNLYVAIATDTGSFQYHKTSAQTFEIVAKLIRAGVNVGKISQEIYASQPRRRFELFKHALVHTQFSADNRIASTSLSRTQAIALGISPEDTEGIIDTLRSIKEVLVAAFFEELPGGKIRLSLRSKNHSLDASSFCQYYGGGGHDMAAGASIAGSLEFVQTNVLERLAKVLNITSTSY